MLKVLVSALACAALLPALASAEPASPQGAAAIIAKQQERVQADVVSALLCTVPLHSPEKTPDGIGAYQYYTSGNGQATCAFYWSPQTGAHNLYLGHLTKFMNKGFEIGFGYPDNDMSLTPINPSSYYTSFVKLFSNGAKDMSTWHAEYLNPFEGGVYTIKNPIWTAYAQAGFEQAKGYPLGESSTSGTFGGICQGCPRQPASPWTHATQTFAQYDANGNVLAYHCACHLSNSTAVWR
ncbi:MAG TPA: hypothetical protein VFZ61_31310 [Polyangiales bacterium]